MVDALLSAALIARDEARHLEACLRSIAALVDEVVVIDTGSADDTPALARRLGARVHRVAWRDDFAAARNAALDLSRGEWILYIDADERVRPGDHERVRGLLRAPALVGCYVWLHAAEGHTAYREMRLFRNHPRIRFEGVIHETIWPAIGRHMAAEGGRIGHSALTLDHVGYHGDQLHKHRRNLPLLLKKLEEDPNHSYSRWHLGAVYRGLGETDKARAAWQAGVAASRRRLGREWSDAQSFIGLIELDFETPEVTAPLLDEAMRLYPDHPHLVWLRAQALMRDRRFAEAVPVLRELVEWSARPRVSDGMLGTDERLFSLFPYDGLAACHFRLGEYAEAERWYALAAACAPERLEYRVKRQLCARLKLRGAGGGEPGPSQEPALSRGGGGFLAWAGPSSGGPCRGP